MFTLGGAFLTTFETRREGLQTADHHKREDYGDFWRIRVHEARRADVFLRMDPWEWRLKVDKNTALGLTPVDVQTYKHKSVV